MSNSAIALSIVVAWFLGGLFAWSKAVEAIEKGEVIAGNKLYSCQRATAMPLPSEPVEPKI
jgi:hypothetical protein